MQFVQLGIAVIAVLISVLALRTAKASFDRQRRPILVFELNDNAIWKVQNVGIGPALNVVAARRSAQAEWDQAFQVPPIAAGDSAMLPWLSVQKGDALACDYCDYEGSTYGSLFAAGRHSAHVVAQIPASISNVALPFKRVV
jgi:hypothetical protein